MFDFFFCDPLEDKILYIMQSRSSFCASPSCRPQLRFGLQSLGLAQKETLLLLGPVAPTPVKVNCRLKCFVTLVIYCYNNVFVYFNLYLNLTHVGATGP
jgi:hypothetical protein